MLFSPSAKLTHGEAIQRDFDEMFGFRAGDEDLRRHFEFESPEFLFAGEMLRRDSRCTPIEKGHVSFSLWTRKDFLGTRIQPGTISRRDVNKQEFCCERIRWNTGRAQPRNALLQQGAHGAVSRNRAHNGSA